MVHRDVTVRVPTLARVEGEGALTVSLVDGEVDDLRFEIYEPPRFFEAFLRGRGFGEPIDLTARICGICPVAYQMSAATALEAIAGVTVDGQLHELRRLIYAGEWIESHLLHIGFLHAPDFLGVDSGIELAATEPDLVRQILELKKLGNDIMEIVGGRPIHPVNVRLGGFHRVPTVAELEPLAPRLDAAIAVSDDLVRWTASLPIPDLVVPREFVSLRGDDAYPVLAGRLVSDRGLDIDPAQFDDEFVERHVERSTALHVRRRDGDVFATGPAARWINNRDLVPGDVDAIAREVDADRLARNPFGSIVVRALEVSIALRTARSVVRGYVEPARSAVDVVPRAGAGWGATEAPRGILLHRYATDDDGSILDARIIPPTAQNQDAIEADLRAVVEVWLASSDRSATGAGAETGDDAGGNSGDTVGNSGEAGGNSGEDALRRRCEFAIRNHDPCISCAAHFLTVRVDERESR